MTFGQERTGAAPTPIGPLSPIDYSERIPNNVNLAEDRRLQRALESWQPKFLDWWKTLGPGWQASRLRPGCPSWPPPWPSWWLR